MHLNRRTRAVGASLVTVLLLGFAYATSLGTSTYAQQPAVPLPSRGILRLAIPNTSPTVDPALVADEGNVELANLMYSGLVRLDPSYNVVPAAAANWKISHDRKHYTFYLRPNLRFSNGDPATAKDFVFGITRSLTASVKSPSAPTYLLDILGAREYLAGKSKSVPGLKAVDARTLQITTYWPVPYLLMELTYPSSFALDQRIVRKSGAIDNSNWYANPVGCGPFRLQSWVANDHMVLVPNKYFYGQRPALKKIIVYLGALPTTDLYQYVSHNLDVVNLPAYDKTLLHQLGIHETQMLAIDGVYMDLRSKPFASRHVRRALIMALDRTSILSQAMGRTVTAFAGFVPPGQSGYDSRLKPLMYDAAAARRELAAAGYSSVKSFPSITLYYPDDPTIGQLAQLMSRAWKKNLGITIDTHALNVNTLFTKAQNDSLPLYILGWSADYPDPHDWLSLQWKSDAVNNNVHYSSKDFDAAVAAADVTWDGNRRLELYHRAQQILVHDAAWIPMYIPHRLVYIRPSVTNLVLTGYGIIPRGGTWAQVRVAVLPSKPRKNS